MANWFEELIRQRKLNDTQALENTFTGIAKVLEGKSGFAGTESRVALSGKVMDRILQYYGCEPVRNASGDDNMDRYLENVCRPLGIMHRRVRLTRNWHRDCSGALLAYMKDGGEPVALIPDGIGYFFEHPDTGARIRITRSNSETLFETEAICFYKPFPLKKITVPGLIQFALMNCPKSELIMMIVLTAMISVVGLIMPSLIHFIYERLVTDGKAALILSTAVFYLCVSVGNTLVSTAQSLLNQRITIRMRTQVESATMMRILSLPARFFRKYSSGELSERSGYVTTLCEQLISSVMSVSLTSVFSLIYIGAIMRYTKALVIPALVILGVTVLFTLYTTRMQRWFTEKRMEVASKESGRTYAMISGIQKIRLCGAENRAFARWGQMKREELELQYATPILLRMSPVFSLLISSVGTLVMYYVAGNNGINQAEYGAFMSAYGMVSGAFMSLVGIVQTIATIRPTLKMIRPILEEEPEAAANKPVIQSVKGRIELNNLTFRYDDNMPLILNDLSMKIEPGQYVAIVGHTGCGKSTLIRLLLGFETPQKGAVYYDGKDIRSIDLRSLRRLIGVVLQNGKLCQGDIYSNITLSAPWLSMDDAWKAAEIAGIAEDIRNMPMGMFTMLSEGGGGISGGQRQRLMIARAIAPEPKILIFDEATSALDNITQKQISEALDALECTRIVVAHRLSTIRHCDRIIYLENGRILEDGTYDELIEKDGAFATMVRRQRLDDEEISQSDSENQIAQNDEE